MGVRELCWRRGDTNFDNMLNIADAVNLLSCLFADGGLWCTCVDTTCRQVFNVNADDRVNIADAVYLLAYIFAGGPAPPPLADTSY